MVKENINVNPYSLEGTTEENIGRKSHLFNQAWETVNLPLEAHNVFEHYALMRDQEVPKPLGADRKKQAGPAIIVGSGESLDDALPLLKDWQGGLFCSSSHISTMAYYGAVPTHMSTPDPRSMISELENIPKEYWDRAWNEETGCTFLQTPIGPIAYTRFWKGRIRWFLVFDPSKEWYTSVLRTGFPWIEDYLLPFTANVPALVAQAQHLGYWPLFLIGADFSNKRFSAWNYKDGEWAQSVGGFQEPKNFVPSANGQVSTPNLLWAKRGVLCTARLNTEFTYGKAWHIYNCSKVTAMDEMPYVKIEKVIKRQGKGFRYPWPKNKLIRTLDVGLARYHTVVLPFHNGMGEGNRIHFAYSQEHLAHQIDQMNAQLQTTLDEYANLQQELKDEAQARGFHPDKVKMIDKEKYLEHYRWAREKATSSNNTR
jgi:hypothetical protein